ncbi:MAG: HsdM family class I SAM-dependent methyltransferase [Jiangellaceae bacterium]
MDSLGGGVDAGHRKARGAFFTPPEICRYITAWAIRDASNLVLEPSCGEAEFLLAAGRRLAELGAADASHVRLAGVELHPGSAQRARDLMATHDYAAAIETADFFSVQPRPGWDVVVGNPPYVRYQDFSGEPRVRAREAALRAGVALSGLASSWAAFMVHAALFLRPGGRLGLVLPAELMTVNYAAEVRRFLLERFAEVRMVAFTDRVFPGVLEEVVLLLADGFDRGPSGDLTIVQARDVRDLQNAVESTWTPADRRAKWTPGLLSADALAAYEKTASGGAFVNLDAWGETTLGMVTGRNDYFALTEGDVAALDLEPSDLLHVSPPGSRHLRRLDLSADRWHELRRAGHQNYLFRPDLDPSTAGLRYISAGERDGVSRAYKCRVREPWWKVPYLRPAHLFLTCMNAEAPQLCDNGARVHHLNSVHGIYLRDGLVDHGQRLLPMAALNSMTLLGAETVGRSYGGGILKIEPKEADRLPMPSPDLLGTAEHDLAAVRADVDQLLQSRGLRDAVALLDEILLVKHAGLRRAEAAALRVARETLCARRHARGASGPRSHIAPALEDAG